MVGGLGFFSVCRRENVKPPAVAGGLGVSDGARTRDNRDHNPVLYQLSYTHHVCIEIAESSGGAD